MNYHDSNHNCCTPCTFKCSTGPTGITGPTGPTGITGPTGPTGSISNASFDGIINTQKIAEPQVAVLLDSATVSNNISYSNGNITLLETGLYYIDFSTRVTTGAGQQINFEIRRTSPTPETILSVSSGTYVNSGSSVILNKSSLFYGTAGDVLNILNVGTESVTINSSSENALDIVIFKIADV